MQQKGEKYKFFATSQIKNTGISDSMVEYLQSERSQQSVQIHYRGIPNASPLFKNIAHDITAEFGMFHVMFNVETLDRLLLLLNKAFDDFDANRVQLTNNDADDKIDQDGNDKTKQIIENKRKENDFTLVQFKSVFKSFGVSFPTKDNMMMESFMKQSTIDVTFTDSSFLHVEGKLGAMTVDYKNETIEKVYPHIMHIQGENLVYFTVDYQLGDGNALPLPSNAPEDTIPYNAIIRLDMNSVQFNYVQEFIEDIVAYFLSYVVNPFIFAVLHVLRILLILFYYFCRTEIKSGKATMEKAEKVQKATAAAASEKYFGYIVNINNPILWLPRSSTSIEGLKADLGKIQIGNRFFNETKKDETLVRETIRIDIAECTLLSTVLNTDTNTQPILEDTDIHIVCFFPSLLLV